MLSAETPPARSASATVVRSIGICAVLLLPALVLRFSGSQPTPVIQLLIYGAAVVAASFLLAWSAEAAQVDISGGLAIAVLALIAVLPEYAVDLSYAYTAGHDPTYVQYAAAITTGSNRLLLGLGWPVVTLLALAAAKRLRRGSGRALELDRANRSSKPSTTNPRLPAHERHRTEATATMRRCRLRKFQLPVHP
jgi:cation:H+ antiporter